MSFSHRARLSYRGFTHRGFTLIEVLIALVIVGIGLVGILSLLSRSLVESGTIVEDSFASTLARSVYESLRESAHKRAFLIKNGKSYVKGFVFLHDGVKETGQTNPPQIPTAFEGPDVTSKIDPLRTSDYTIFLPNAPAPGATGPNTGEDVFVFPRPGGADADNGTLGGSPNLPGKSNFLPNGVAGGGYAGEPVFYDVKRVYELKSRTPPEIANGTDQYKTPPELADQYSFALLVRRCLEPVLTANDDGKTPLPWGSAGTLDANTFPPRGILPNSSGVYEDGLYQVEIWVYRNFDPLPTSRLHKPVRGGALVGLIALGG